MTNDNELPEEIDIPESVDPRFSFGSPDTDSYIDFKTPVSDRPTSWDPTAHAISKNAGESSSSDPLIGAQIDNYRVLSAIGKGGFGSVYKAHDTKLKRDAAIKFLHNPDDPEFYRRFAREAQVLANLSKHPHIVQIYTWGDYHGESYFALELMDQSAGDLLKHHPDGAPLLQVMRIGSECTAALHHAHKAGILHRDIKPANILIDEATGTSKLCDFGLAMLQEPDEDMHSTVVAGSPAYMSPEQASGKPLDARSDIYSLGITLYRLLTGKLPFKGKTLGEIYDQMRNNEYKMLGDARPDLPKEVCRVIDRCINTDPEKRYHDARKLEADIRHIVSDLERSGTVQDTASPWYQRRYAGAALLITVVALVGGIASAIYPYSKTTSDKSVPSENSNGANGLIATGNITGASPIDAAMVAMAARQEQEEHKTLVRQQLDRLRERIEAAPEERSPEEEWTSRPLRVRIEPVTEIKSEFANTSGLAASFPELLAERLGLDAGRPLEVVNREFVGDTLFEQELSDLSTEMDRVQLGRLLGARVMIQAEFGTLLNEEFLRVKVIDTETTKMSQVGRIGLTEQIELEAWLNEVTQKTTDTILSAYPLQGKMAVEGGAARINIGTNVGVREGMRFAIYPRPDSGQPLDNVQVEVTGPIDADACAVHLIGASLEAVPEGGWFLRRIEEDSI